MSKRGYQDNSPIKISRKTKALMRVAIALSMAIALGGLKVPMFKLRETGVRARKHSNKKKAE